MSTQATTMCPPTHICICTMLTLLSTMGCGPGCGGSAGPAPAESPFSQQTELDPVVLGVDSPLLDPLQYQLRLGDGGQGAWGETAIRSRRNLLIPWSSNPEPFTIDFAPLFDGSRIIRLEGVRFPEPTAQRSCWGGLDARVDSLRSSRRGIARVSKVGTSGYSITPGRPGRARITVELVLERPDGELLEDLTEDELAVCEAMFDDDGPARLVMEHELHVIDDVHRVDFEACPDSEHEVPRLVRGERFWMKYSVLNILNGLAAGTMSDALAPLVVFHEGDEPPVRLLHHKHSNALFEGTGAVGEFAVGTGFGGVQRFEFVDVSEVTSAGLEVPPFRRFVKTSYVTQEPLVLSDGTRSCGGGLPVLLEVKTPESCTLREPSTIYYFGFGGLSSISDLPKNEFFDHYLELEDGFDSCTIEATWPDLDITKTYEVSTE